MQCRSPLSLTVCVYLQVLFGCSASVTYGCQQTSQLFSIVIHITAGTQEPHKTCPTASTVSAPVLLGPYLEFLLWCSVPMPDDRQNTSQLLTSRSLISTRGFQQIYTGQLTHESRQLLQ
eukprot:GHUV01039887.1.p1 GENE.GHUV01039887.1~~GHUV01039887.1.p1  ORF type:complete len:119 (-),score=5.47 GHUV01039887.1:117-473(-)